MSAFYGAPQKIEKRKDVILDKTSVRMCTHFRRVFFYAAMLFGRLYYAPLLKGVKELSVAMIEKLANKKFNRLFSVFFYKYCVCADSKKTVSIETRRKKTE